MLRLLSDENFNGDIVRGLLFRDRNVAIIRVQDVMPLGTDDPDVLAWAANDDRILLTHDRATMPDYAYARILAGERMPGVFVINDRFPVGAAITELILLNDASEQSEWNNRIEHLPL